MSLFILGILLTLLLGSATLLAAGYVLFGLLAMLVCIFFWLLVLVAEWRIYTKAGQPGWASLVPFYNDYISYKIFWGKGWLFLLPLVLGFLQNIDYIGFIASLLCLVLYAATQYKKSVAFGHGIPFAVGLFFLPTIFELILAFSDDYYHGVPQDGFSYDQLRHKYGKYAPDTDNISFTSPDGSRKDEDIVDEKRPEE